MWRFRLWLLASASIFAMGYTADAWVHPGHGGYRLEVVRSLTNTRVLAVRGTIGYARIGNDPYQLIKSTDEFVTTQPLFRFPSYAPLNELTVLKSGTLIAHVGTSPFSLWRSTDQGVTFTKAFDFPSSGSTWIYRTLTPDNLTEDNQGRVYLSTYNTCPCNSTRNYMWYSDTDGRTWLPLPGFSPDASGNLPPVATAFRHIHSLEYDPQTGTLYVIAGDGHGGVWKSTDGGGSFQPLCTGRYTECVAVDAEVGSGFMIYGTDLFDTNANVIYRLATNTGKPPSEVRNDEGVVNAVHVVLELQARERRVSHRGDTRDHADTVVRSFATRLRHHAGWSPRLRRLAVPCARLLVEQPGADHITRAVYERQRRADHLWIQLGG